VKRNLDRIQSYRVKNNITAYRLINNIQFSLPLTVDIYQDNALIHVLGQIESAVYKELESVLRELVQVKHFFYKKSPKDEFVIPQSPAGGKIVQQEFDCKFLVNLTDYMDTGLFLDHRETRKWIGSQSINKIVLNTFAYTGSFSIYAAKGGASRTYSVDISSVYCNWIKENLNINELPLENNWVIKMDTQEYFRYAKKKNLIFDIIIIDPPTFANSKNGSFSLQKDHPQLINRALEVMAPGGFILFSNNYKEFRMNRQEISPCLIREKTDTLPPDFSGTQPHHCFIISKQPRY
jgi:23S rRNA G2069 N7-methylase RlmK/C1962 C5-methylase RlmI